jgi:hypothetical protein
LWDTLQKFSKVDPCLRAKFIALVQPNELALLDLDHIEEYRDSLSDIERSDFSEYQFDQIETGGLEWSALWHRVLTKDPMVGLPCYPWEFEEVFVRMEQSYQISSNIAARMASGVTSGEKSQRKRKRKSSSSSESSQSSSESEKDDAEDAMHEAASLMKRNNPDVSNAGREGQGEEASGEGDGSAGGEDEEGGQAGGEDEEGGVARGEGQAGGEDEEGGVARGEGQAGGGAELEEDLRENFGA